MKQVDNEVSFDKEVGNDENVSKYEIVMKMDELKQASNDKYGTDVSKREYGVI